MKTCVICDSPLKRGATKYCSYECRGKSVREATIASRPPCAKCGQPVKKPQYRFCSQECAGKGRQERHPCAQCGKPVKLQRQYCSVACRVEASKGARLTLVCHKCGKTYERYRSQVTGKHNYCSNECRSKGRVYKRGADHPQWKGGTYWSSAGYLYEVDYTKSTKPDGSYGYKAQHIRVAEEALGRSIAKGEHVHHINGNKLDNRPDNLLVLTNKEHRALHSFYAQSFQKEHEAKGDLVELTTQFLNQLRKEAIPLQ